MCGFVIFDVFMWFNNLWLCVCVFCNLWVCVCVGCVICGGVYVWVL